MRHHDPGERGGSAETSPALSPLDPHNQIIAQAVQAQMAGELEVADRLYRLILGQRSEDPIILFGYGSLRLSMDDYPMAILLLQAAAEYDPPLEYKDQIFCNLGVALKWEGRHQSAIDCFEKSKQVLDEIEEKGIIEPKEITRRRRAVTVNHGSMFINYGEPRTAERYFTDALELDKALGIPNPQTQWNLSLALLEQGKFDRGFDLYDAGIAKGDRKDRTYWQLGNTPFWEGQKTGTLVIYGEQGIGDEVMFASMFEEVRPFADRVIIDCTPKLLETFKRSFPWADVFCSDSTDLPPWARGRKVDHKILMGTLARLYRRDLEAFKRGPDRYLVSNPAQVEDVRWRLGKLPHEVSVAMMWRGGTKQTNSKERSVPLAQWKDILDLPANFISLQYTPQAAEESVRYKVHHWQPLVDDIDAQVAIIDACDLVITCCGTTAHLAGALGKPCWVLTPIAQRWCYAGAHESMPFYRSVRCFRQKQRSDWKEPLRKAARELADYIRVQEAQRDAA